jgi:uncharacterized protein YkwD
MRPLTSRRLRRLVVPALAACSLATTVAAPASAASPCAAGDRQPAHMKDSALRATTLCLLNAERAAHGLRPLRLDSRLSRASRGHSRDMAANRYFAHESRSGARFSARIASTGWMTGRSRWSIGENIAWGSGTQATPRSIVSAWMHSAEHRANILDGGFRVIGVGVARHAPVAASSGATYTTDFGS